VKNQRPRHCYKYTSGYLGGAHDTNIHVRLRVMQAGAGRPSRVVVVPVNSRNSYSSIRGMQIYSPWEKTLYSKKSCEPYYTRLKSLAAKVQLMLTESLNSKEETQVFKNAQEEVKHLINHGYAIHSSTLRFHSENAKCPVRFEFVVLSNDVFHNEDVFQCPISTLSDDIRATIVQACSYHVCCDLVRQLTFFFPPLIKLVEQEFSNLTKYSPVMKTMLVFCAEGVENILDTGRFFLVESTEDSKQNMERIVWGDSKSQLKGKSLCPKKKDFFLNWSMACPQIYFPAVLLAPGTSR